MKTIVTLALVAWLSAASAFADQQLSTSTNVSSYSADSVFLQGPSQIYTNSKAAPPGTSLSDSGSTSVPPWASADGSVNLYYGSCGMTASGTANESASEGMLGSGSGSLSAQWTSQITINSPGMEGQPVTVRLTYHGTGAVSGTGTSYLAVGSASYSYSVGGSDGNSVYFSGSWDTQNYSWSGDGSPNRTFTLDTTCTVGQPSEITNNVSWSVGAGTSEPDFGDPHDGHAQANGNLSLRSGSFVVLDSPDPGGHLLDYTADLPSGSAQAVTYPAGASFSNFGLTNAAPDRFGSTMQLLDGQASADTQVVAAFVAPPTDNAIKPVSDVVDLSGTNSDPVVVKVNFDASAAGTFFGSKFYNYVALAWFQNSSGTWRNAVLGNTGTTQPTVFNRGYNPATDFHLGYFGVDAVNNYAWAVVNHNSQFVVTVPQPDLAVTSVTRAAPTTIHLACKGEPARANRIETSPDLSANSWTTLATVTAGGDGSFTFDDANATGPKKFYRVAYP